MHVIFNLDQIKRDIFCPPLQLNEGIEFPQPDVLDHGGHDDDDDNKELFCF